MSITQPDRRTLICVLDWGLGHASRSLALAGVLERGGEKPSFASSGRALVFLKTERPDLICHELPAYNVTYPTRSMPLNVALQLPRWLRTIWRERGCIRRLVASGAVDRVVSDNRFGCYTEAVPSIFLTHQLHPITGNRLVSRIYRAWLQRFDGFWVPDHEAAERRVSGQLSAGHGYKNVRYIGPLSRLRGTSSLTPPVAGLDVSPGLSVLMVLSGPEPMRTRLEDILLRQLPDLPGEHVLIRGLPGGAPAVPDPPANLTVHAFADAEMLERLIPAARHIVCRSGYSTLMDVFALVPGNNLILVPTPGQTEQVYLAERMRERVGCRAAFIQEKLDLSVLPA